MRKGKSSPGAGNGGAESRSAKMVGGNRTKGNTYGRQSEGVALSGRPDNKRKGADYGSYDAAHLNNAQDLVRAKKHLGQHFLTDLNIARKIAESLGGGTSDKQLSVLEVGPGMGVLTKYLLERDDLTVYAAEIDSESVTYLKSHYPDLRPRLIEGDFLQMDIAAIFPAGVSIIGNFPYNISSQIFFKVLENRNLITEVVGMIQKEVAVRIAEPPGSREYGILSVLLQAWYDIEYLFTVNENVFNPPPKVKSAVIRLRRNAVESLGCNEKLFVKVVKASFGQRRKMLRNSLRSVFGNLGAEEHRFFSERAEQLGVADFVELTNWIEARI